jgi:hypothetical protein
LIFRYFVFWQNQLRASAKAMIVLAKATLLAKNKCPFSEQLSLTMLKISTRTKITNSKQKASFEKETLMVCDVLF